jgi:hypothetical protein
MGKNKKNAANTAMQDVSAQAKTQYNSLMNSPSQVDSELAPFSQNAHDLSNKSNYRQMQDYGDIMGQYDDIANSPGSGPHNFTYKNVEAKTPEELKESYGYLREAAPGYRDFAANGGYSGQDVQELRARGMSPIRSAYGNTMMEMDRARAIGGNGGAPNYIAAASKAQREMPGQMADAMTTVNAGLAEQIREGKKFGLQGLTETGSTMGGLSSADAARILSADQGNQQADLQAQAMSEQSRRQSGQERLAALSGKTSLYGTTPAMANMFGNQALSAYGTRAGIESQRQQTGLGLLAAQMQGYGPQANAPAGTPGWQTALGVAGTVAPYVAQYYGSKNAGSKAMLQPSRTYGPSQSYTPTATGTRFS